MKRALLLAVVLIACKRGGRSTSLSPDRLGDGGVLGATPRGDGGADAGADAAVDDKDPRLHGFRELGGARLRSQLVFALDHPAAVTTLNLSQTTGAFDAQTHIFASDVVSALPPSIGQLTALRTMLVTGGGVTWLPREIGQLLHLERLDLQTNQLTALPDELAKLAVLRELDLSGNPLVTFPGIVTGLPALQILRLRNTQLTALPAEIGNLANLIELDLNMNGLTTTPPELARLDKLTILRLGHNQLTSVPAAVTQLTHLRELVLDGNPLTALPPGLATMKSLKDLELDDVAMPHAGIEALAAARRDLHIAYSPRLFKSVAEALANPQQVLGLELRDAPFDASALAKLPRLEVLHLMHVGMTALPPELLAMPHLRELDLSQNELTTLPAGIAALHELTSLRVDGNHLRSVPPELAQLTHLTTLELGDNELEELPDLTALTRLRDLGLGENFFGDPDMLKLLVPPKLFFVASPKRTRTIAEALRHPARVQVLDLKDSGLEAVPADVGKLLELRILDVSGLHIKKLPDEISHLVKLAEIFAVDTQISATQAKRIRTLVPHAELVLEREEPVGD